MKPAATASRPPIGVTSRLAAALAELDAFAVDDEVDEAEVLEPLGPDVAVEEPEVVEVARVLAVEEGAAL